MTTDPIWKECYGDNIYPLGIYVTNQHIIAANQTIPMRHDHLVPNVSGYVPHLIKADQFIYYKTFDNLKHVGYDIDLWIYTPDNKDYLLAIWENDLPLHDPKPYINNNINPCKEIPLNGGYKPTQIPVYTANNNGHSQNDLDFFKKINKAIADHLLIPKDYFNDDVYNGVYKKIEFNDKDADLKKAYKKLKPNGYGSIKRVLPKDKLKKLLYGP